MKGKPLFFFLLIAMLVPGVLFADPVAIHGVGVSSKKLANGKVMVNFTVRVEVKAAPLVFNYHWERSDGAKTGIKVWSVKPGVTSVPVTTTWELGPQHPAEIWEKLYLNTGTTHLESDPITVALPQ